MRMVSVFLIKMANSFLVKLHLPLREYKKSYQIGMINVFFIKMTNSFCLRANNFFLIKIN